MIRAEAVKEPNWDITLKIAARNLPNSTSCLIFPNNQVFFEILRGSKTNPKNLYKIYHSDVAQGTNSPVYAPFKMSGVQLCNSDKNVPV